MNGKTVKLIRKWCHVTNNDPKRLKRVWKNVPRNKRGKLSTNMRLELVPAKETYDIVNTPEGTFAISK